MPAKKTKAAATISAEDIDKAVREALLKVATSDTPFKLSGKATPTTHPGLFASTAGANKPAIEQIQAADDPLLAEDKKDKKVCVRLTAAGFQKVLPELPEEKIGEAAKQVAEGLPLTDRVEFLNEIIGRTPLAASELLPLVEKATTELKEAEDAKVETARKRREAQDASLKAVERWKELVQEQRKIKVEGLKRQLEVEGVKPDSGAGGAVELPGRMPPPFKAPADRDDLTFRREVAERLVATWQESFRLNRPDGRLFLETALGNVGRIRQIGEEGETVPFDGKYHETDQGVATGTPVRVVRPGWVLEEEDGEYRLLTANVSP